MAWFVPIYVAGWFVPASRRAEWRWRWTTNLTHWRVLVERGELPPGSASAFFQRAFADACHERFGVLRFHRILRGPAVLFAAFAAALAIIAICSRGFAVTRRVIALANDFHLHPHYDYRYDVRGDRLFEYLTPIAIAAAVGIALLFFKRRSFRSLGYTQWSLLLFQVMAAHLLASLLWMEAGFAIRSHLTRGWLHYGVGGFGLAVTYIILVGRATLWSLADQRCRCPVCLHRLMLPVAMGSWASIFDPAATELVCEEGHGSLALMEREAEASPQDDRWIELDSSWRELFPKDAGKSR